MDEKEHRLHRLFYPRSIAVVGAKREGDYSWLRRALNFPGPKYNVNIDRAEWPGAAELGVPSYASVADIPDHVDYVSITVPAPVVPRILEDCINKGVIGAQMFTSGFSETGTEEGLRLEETITRMARESGLLLVGPNCLGLYNPDTGFGQDRENWKPGHIGFISQSGITAVSFMEEAELNGVPISKVVSMGNGVILDAADYMDYFLHDPQTRVIALFLEGIRDGRKFFTTLRAASREKPVLVWKVGETEDSARAAASHSGSAPGSQAVYESLLRQCGALRADSTQEMIDTAKALLLIPPLSGPRLGLYSISGGRATQMANYFAKSGFRVPQLSEASQATLNTRYSSPLINYHNPIESTSFNRIEEFAAHVLDGLDTAEEIDAIVHEWAPQVGPLGSPDDGARDARLSTMLDFASRATKPYIVVLAERHPMPPPDVVQSVHDRLMQAGVPTFHGVERGARALRNAFQYQSFRHDLEEYGGIPYGSP